MSISFSVPAPILSTHSHLHPLVHIFYALMHQAHSKTPPYIQLLARLAGLTLPLEVTSSRKPTLLLLPPPNEFHPVPPALKAARSAHPRQLLPCPLPLPVTYWPPTPSHLLLEADPHVAHPILGTCLAVLSVFVGEKEEDIPRG